MDIHTNSYNSFKSKNFPIQPFAIKTKRGKLRVCEVSGKDLKQERFILNLTKLFCKNFASATNDPNWRKFTNPKTFDFNKTLENFVKYYRSKIVKADENMTLLLVKDKRNKIQGACLSYGCDSVPDTKEITYYIDSIAVNPAYRGFNVGKMLIEKTLESARNKFTDAFLAGDKTAKKFYESLGFETLNINNHSQKQIIDYVSRRRNDIPDYVELYTKPLQKDKPRWYDDILVSE